MLYVEFTEKFVENCSECCQWIDARMWVITRLITNSSIIDLRDTCIEPQPCRANSISPICCLTPWLQLRSSDYDVSRAPASTRRQQKMNMSFFVVVVSQSNRNCDIGFTRHSRLLWSYCSFYLRTFVSPPSADMTCGRPSSCRASHVQAPTVN